MKSTAFLLLSAPDSRALASLAAVLAPDNVGLPKGLELSSHASGPTLTYRVDAEAPAAAVTTVLALLRDVELFQEVWLLSSKKDGSEHPR